MQNNMQENTKVPNITAVVIARNEEEMITACLDTLTWCESVLVLDNGSEDETRKKAELAGATVVSFKSSSFARVREEATKHVRTEWILYVDADERVSPTLAKEIGVKLETSTASVFSMHRKNYFFGHEISFGGWQHDQVTRVFKLDALEGWYGDIHESPKFTGSAEVLHSPLLHFTHRSVVSNLKKSAEWTPKEAEAFISAAIQPVTFFTLVRKGSMEFFRRAIVQEGYRDGMPGLVEALIQAMNRVWVYIQVWELQLQPSISDRYQVLEKELQKKWKTKG